MNKEFNHKSVAMNDPFVQTGDGGIIPVREITYVDDSQIEKLKITVSHTVNNKPRQTVIKDVQAIEALLLLKPSALEGKRLRWARQAWLYHNTVGHSYLALMSVLAWSIRPQFPETARKLVRHGIYVHDHSCPIPTVKPTPK